MWLPQVHPSRPNSESFSVWRETTLAVYTLDQKQAQEKKSHLETVEKLQEKMEHGILHLYIDTVQSNVATGLSWSLYSRMGWLIAARRPPQEEVKRLEEVAEGLKAAEF